VSSLRYNNKTIRRVNNIVNYIFEKLQFEDPRVVSDSSYIEIISGKEEPPKEEEQGVDEVPAEDETKAKTTTTGSTETTGTL